MAKEALGKRVALKKYPGVYVRETSRGKTFDINFRRGQKLIWEKIGYESDGFSAQLAATIRGNRIKTIRFGEELPQDRDAIPPFKIIAKKYLEWAELHKASWKNDETRYRLYLSPLFDNWPIDAIRPADLEKLKADLIHKSKSPATVKQVLALFRAIFNRAVQWGLVRAENPINFVKLPKLDNSREKFLSVEDSKKLLTDLKKRSPKAYGVALLALNTGARKGELLGLRWIDADMNSRVLVFCNTKNGKTRRVPMTEEVFRYLSNLPKAKSTDLIFAGKGGQQIQYLTSAFDNAADLLFNEDLPKDDRRNRVVFHTLRHTAASHMVMNGVPLSTVKEILGHSTLAMVDRYSHLSPDAQREAVKSISIGIDQ